MDSMIRDFQQKDFEDILPLAREEMKESGEDVENADVRKALEGEGRFDLSVDRIRVLVLKDSRVIGWYRYSPWPAKGMEGKSAHLFDIAVLPPYQKMGYGKMLFQSMLEDAKKNGYSRVFSHTSATNVKAVNFHKRVGFEIYKSGTDDMVWIMELSAS